MNVLDIINLCLGIVFLLCYFYQIVFLIIAIFSKKKSYPDAPPKDLAVLIAARNESGVIKRLIDSLVTQEYPKDRYRIFVVADNCTDNTAEIAREAGAIVYERFNENERGKGYALNYLIAKIKEDFPDRIPDGYIVFDADNVAEKNYLYEMNKPLAAGYEVVSAYRNASNYGENWRAGGQGMYFLRDARVLNYARALVGTNTFISGTGFLFSRSIEEKYGGWPFHTLTEDGEFTLHNAVNGAKCAYCQDAVFYDEQATDLKTSWNQKLRWCKGGLQIFKKYFKRLMHGIFVKRSLSCFDMVMCLTPAYVLSLLAVSVNTVGLTALLITGTDPRTLFISAISMVTMAYLSLLMFSVFVTISEWKRIKASTARKILYVFTFPIFIFSFIPPAAVALFKKVEWKQIKHTGNESDTGSENCGTEV